MKSIRFACMAILLVVLVLPVMGQRHVIKFTPLKLIPFPLSNVQFGYEYAATEKFSVGVDLKIGIPSSIADQELILDEVELESGVINTARLGGYAITPQVRFYLGSKGAPAGFYLNPWIRFFGYNVNTDVTWIENPQNPSQNSEIDARFTYGGFGAGFSLGWQWLIGDHFVIDWNVGLGGLAARFGISGTVNGPLEDDLQDFVDEFNNAVDGAPFFRGSLTNDGTGLSLRGPYFPLPLIRSNLSFGIAF